MNWRRRKTNSPPGTGGVAEGRGGSKVEIVLLDSNERMGRRVLRSIYHPVAARHPSCSRRGVELLFLLLQFIHTFIDPDLTGVAETGGNAVDRCTEGIVDFRTVFSAAPAAE